MKRFFKAGFTLMEVNLAIFIMAVGSLAMVALYPLGFKETEQSREDVVGAAIADEILSPLVAVLSSTNMTWQSWKSIPETIQPGGNGWYAYYNNSPGRGTMNNYAQQAFNALANKASIPGGSASFPDLSQNKMTAGLVYKRDGARVMLGCRVSRLPGNLLAQPMYYTEVHFQGDPEQ